MVDESIVTAVRAYLNALRGSGLPVSFGVIFGSQSIGTPDAWSDIDLLVVSPRFDERRSRHDIGLLWRTAARADSRIEPIACGEQQWQSDDTSAIIEIARRQGERVAVPDGAELEEELQALGLATPAGMGGQ